MQGNGFKIAAIVALLLISLWKLFPTVQNALNQRDLAAMDATTRTAYQEEHADDLLATREASLKLGLDLQGGMHVTLEVGTGALLRELAEGRVDETFEAALATATAASRTSDTEFVTPYVPS